MKSQIPPLIDILNQIHNLRQPKGKRYKVIQFSEKREGLIAGRTAHTHLAHLVFGHYSAMDN